MQKYNCCTILATTSVAFDKKINKNKIFVNFFDPILLQPFNYEQAYDLLNKIAKQLQDKELLKFLQTPSGSARVKAVHQLAGGNPRIYTLFSQLITKEDLDEVVGSFMKLLDNLTPYYERQMMTLPNQQQKILDYLADNREAKSIKDIKNWTFITSQTLSSQLKDLKANEFLKSTQDGRESYYEIKNVLMRLCLELKKYRGKWVEVLIEILRIWYSSDELQSKLEKYQQSEYDCNHTQTEIKQSVLETPSGDITKNVDREIVLLQEGIALFSSNKLEEAIKNFEKAIEVNPNLCEAFYYKGVALCINKEPEQALESYKRAIEIKQDYYDAWNSCGLVLNDLGEYAQAKDSCDRAIDIDPNDPKARYHLGNALLNLEKYEDAINSYDKSIEINSNFYQSYNNRGIALVLLDRYQDAIESFKQATSIKEDYHEAWFNLGICQSILSQL